MRNTHGYEPVGETEYNEYLRKKAVGKSMKSVRQVVLQSLNEGAEGLEIQVSKHMVKALALLALQPMAFGYSFDKVEYDMVVFHEVLFKQPVFMVCYAAVFLMLGFFLGYFFNKEIQNQKFARVLNWASGQIESAKKNIEYVDDWDPDTQSLRQYRVLASPEEAESGEEYFKETTNGLARFVRPHAFVRQRLNVEELDPLEMSMVDLREEFEEEEKEDDPMEIDYTVPALSQPAVPGIGAQTRDDPQRETSSSMTRECVMLARITEINS